MASLSKLPHCKGQGAAGILLYTTPLQQTVVSGAPSKRCCIATGRGQQGLFNTLLHCRGSGVRGATFALCGTIGGIWHSGCFSTPPHCRAWRVLAFLNYAAALQAGQWLSSIHPYTTADGEQWGSFSTLPHRREQWVEKLLLYCHTA